MFNRPKRQQLVGPYRVYITVFNAHARSYHDYQFLIEQAGGETDALAQAKVK